MKSSPRHGRDDSWTRTTLEQLTALRRAHHRRTPKFGKAFLSYEADRRANAVHPVTALQSEYSIWTLRTPADLDKLDDSDFRKNHPRFTGENFQRNLRIADQTGATPAQVALAWVLAQGNDIVPIPGTKRVSRAEENTAADAVKLTSEQVAALTALPPAEGGHHTDDQMNLIER
ncbi:aldo/keto reductase [Actinoplanes hulinensis]|uniref:aldo/keto reductase n=1 Tax=Actinoplanes hulinensis TaxID=1144547 RepID=UPI001FE552DA|nr:aldo/keto reductase [Actinoplanes hulinensis]